MITPSNILTEQVGQGKKKEVRGRMDAKITLTLPSIPPPFRGGRGES